MSRNRVGAPIDSSRREGCNYRTSHDVFSSAYLEDRLPETDVWEEIDEDELRMAFEEIRTCWERVGKSTASESRTRLEETFVRPVFQALGHSFVRTERPDRTRYRPDYVFLESDDARDAFDCTEDGDSSDSDEDEGSGDGDENGDSGDNDNSGDEAIVAIADVRHWERALEARGGSERERDAETPCYRIHAALRESSVEWAVLTNGRRWRLYTERTGHRLDAYYEIDLPAVLETGDLETFKYFYLCFRRDAFRDDAEGNCLLDDLYDRSAEFSREMGATLEENAAEALEVLARGFRRYPGNDLGEDRTETDSDDAPGHGELDLLYDASLVVLVRLIVAFAAESRRRRLTELPDERGSNEHGDDKHGDDEQRGAESGTEPVQSTSLRSIARAVAAESDGSGPSYTDRTAELWSRLEDLGSPIGRRNRADEDDSRTARFLENHRVGDASLARVIDLLARERTDSGGKPFVDYSSLDGRRLGGIYEGLLEYRLAIADEPLALADGEYVPASDGDTVAVAANEVYLTADGDQRKASGSYYTPEHVVEHVVEETVGPLLEEIRTEFAAVDADRDDGLADADLDRTDGVAERAFELSVLDPAMGTGHFLTCALEYLTREIVAAEDAAARAGLESVPADRGVDEVRRRVARRCLYGVDRDPLAVELATASLQLRTLSAEGPPAALDHHLKTGNALVGSDLEAVADCASRADLTGDDATRLETEPTRGGVFGRTDGREWRDRRQRLEAMANVHTAREFGLEGVPDDALERLAAALESDDDWDPLSRTEWFTAAQKRASAEGFFHWGLEFPELYADANANGDDDRVEAPGFDAVLGNPPWVATAGRGTISATIDASLRSYLEDAFSATENQFDLYVAFYERSIRLSRDGRVGIVVPDSILAREGNEPIREYVLSETSLAEIVRLGTAFDGVESGAAILVSGGDGTDVRCADATTAADLASLSADSDRVNSIPASVFEAADANRFLIYLDRETRSVCSTVAAHPPLGDAVSVSRGEEISKRADVLRERPGPTTRPIAPGSAVCRYGIDADELRFVEPTDLEKVASNYESPKLLVRQTSDSLVGTYDADDLATIKSTYNVRSDAESPAELKHILGALHSSALAFYHHYTHAAYRAVFPQINQSTLEGLPIPMAAGPDDELVAAVEKRLALTAERSAIDLHVPDYLGRDLNGPSLGDLDAARRTDGVAATKLASTTEECPNLRIGSVAVDSSDSDIVRISATVRYKPDPAAAAETDRWGYAETDPIPAVELVDVETRLAALVEAIVPYATEAGDGVAGFRPTAAKTISPLDRLEALTLPRPNEVEDGLCRFLDARDRAAELEAAIDATDRRIDDRACSLYGLTDVEREIVRREFGGQW
ncbi:TaqI-like C-terminal specificity domain-containing protein [Natrinema sp. DC36]|uniref:Eco57I restriction-modification methylase domain-containing protein n=1 Tax=Natrinema sp. DC36 TaxID=2878680 RepID=UPI001CEFDF07|nr:TaqI-like C-terminal specificity domain-containing protein [Natrinema sp. DC36]